MSQTPDYSGTATSLGQVAPAAGAIVPTGPQSLEPARPAAFSGFQCSQCGSEDIQKLSMVYEAGTSVIDTRSRGSSTGIGITRGGLGIGTAVNSSRTRGTQTSEIAKRAAPPPAKTALGWLVLGLVGGLLLWALAGPILALALFGLCIFLMIKGNAYNGGELVKLREAWNQSWLCHRCGTISRIEPR